MTYTAPMDMHDSMGNGQGRSLGVKECASFAHFCTAVRPKIEHLYTLLDGHIENQQDKTPYHPWDRPGLALDPSRLPSNTFRLTLALPEQRPVFVSRRRKENEVPSFSLSCWVASTASGIGEVLMVIDIGSGLDAQTPRVQQSWHKAAHAPEVLAWAIAAIDGGLPMAPNQHWDTHLVKEAACLANDGAARERFGQWVSQWGSVQTQSAWHITNALFDPKKEFDIWKEALILHMESLGKGTVHEPMDTTLFSGA